MRIVAAFLLFIVPMLAQEQKPLTDNQKLQLSEEQVKFLEAQNTLTTTPPCSQATQQLQQAQQKFATLQQQFCPGGSLIRSPSGDWSCAAKDKAPAPNQVGPNKPPEKK